MNENFLPCDDFLQFKKLLTNLRKTDDRINNELNSALPTESFSKNIDSKSICQRFYEEMIQSHKYRERQIKKCLKDKTDHLDSLLKSTETSAALSPELRKEHNFVKQYKSELLEEEIIQDSSLKIFYQRCRDFYKPKDLKPFD